MLQPVPGHEPPQGRLPGGIKKNIQDFLQENERKKPVQVGGQHEADHEGDAQNTTKQHQPLFGNPIRQQGDPGTDQNPRKADRKGKGGQGAGTQPPLIDDQRLQGDEIKKISEIGKHLGDPQATIGAMGEGDK